MREKIKGKVNNFFSRYNLLEFQKNEYVIREEEEPRGVYFVRAGYVKMVVYFLDGKELTLNIFKPGSYFPMMWAVGGVSNKYNFKAFTKTSLHRASKENVEEFMKKNPDVFEEFSKRLMVGVDGLLLNMKQMLSGDVYTRVISALVLSGKRFGEKDKNGLIVLKPSFTHQDIASMVGVARESVSIVMKKLADRKIISYKGRQLGIRDFSKLEEELYIDREAIEGVSAL